MKVRAFLLSLLAASLLCFPVGASQPEGLAGKLISNPAFEPARDPGGGLPGVTCFGFGWGEVFTRVVPDPADTITLDMAIIPFRSGSTKVSLPNLLHLRFADGMVNGLPYRRFGWNSVRVVVRPATQDYLLTLNGVQAGPFPNEYPCGPADDCVTLLGFILRGDVFDESIAWVDSLSVVHDSAAGQAVLLEESFDQCDASHNVSLGGLLIEVPPGKLGSGRTR